MVSWKAKITGSNPNSATLYGGQQVDYILDYFSNVDLSVAGVDSNGIGDIATYTYFNSNTLNLWDSNRSHSIRFQTPDYTNNKTVTFPSQAAMQSTDELMFKDAVQIVRNKTLSLADNVISDLPNQSGIAAANTFTDDGNLTVYNIPHGLGSTPDFAHVEAASDDARGDFKVTKDPTNIIVTYASATPAGSDNISLMWSAGYINFSSYLFTPDSLTTITQKTIGDGLTFDVILTPSNPGADKIIIYPEAIDANNDGIFAIVKKGGSFVKLQLG